MGRATLALSAAAAVCVALPSPGMFVAMGMGFFALVAGQVSYRRRAGDGDRLAGALASGLGGIALSLALVRLAATLIAVGRLEALG